MAPLYIACTNNYTFTSFPIWMALFSLYCLIALANTSSTVLRWNKDNMQPIISCFNGLIRSVQHLGLCCLWVYHKEHILCWEIFPPVLFSLGILSWRHLNFVEVFSASIVMFVSFESLITFWWFIIFFDLNM